MSCRFSLRLLFAIGACAGWLGGPLAQAASSVLIWPINPSIPAAEKATALWLENRGPQPVRLQVRVMKWQQRDFADELLTQTHVVGSPPMATVEPGKRQMIRLIRMQPVPAGTQQAYRVLVDELLPEVKTAQQDNVQFQMRYSVPLFVYGDGAQYAAPQIQDEVGARALRPALSFHIERSAGQAYLYLSNSGTAHARLSDVQFSSGEQEVSLATGLLGYVLPGAQMRWLLPKAAADVGITVLEARFGEQSARQRIEAK